MDKIYHRVVLAGDTATAPDEASGILGSPGTLNFGRAGNNGIHVLRMELAQDWQGLVVKAAFRTPSGCYPALMDENNEIAVPASVTAQATSALLGLISFDGTDSAGRARAGNLLYYVEDAGCPACPTPPDPDVWQMLVQMFIAAMPKQAAATGGYKIGTGLVVDEETNTLSVDTAKAVEEDNTKPVTSAAVYTQLGNVEALLHSI